MDFISAIPIILAIVSFMIAIYFGYPHLREAKTRKEKEQFLLVRKYLKKNRLKLTKKAFEFYKENSVEYVPLSCKLEDEIISAFILTKTGWVPNPAISFEKIRILKDQNWNTDIKLLKNKAQYYQNSGFKSTLKAFGYLWPKSFKESKLPRYSDIVDELDKPKLWWNMPHYRITNIKTEEGYELVFRVGTYFDSFSTLEALAYESAKTDYLARKSGRTMNWDTLKARKVSGDPNILNCRCSGLGVETIILFGQDGDYRFVLHQRSSKDVAIGEGLVHIVPAGEFQPSSDSNVMIDKDFDIWKNIMREYYEELINPSIASERIKYEIDWENDLPFKQLNQAKKENKIQLFFLGFIINPLNLKPEILTALVFSEQAFHESIGSFKERNEEGRIIWNIKNQTFEGHKFDEKTVKYYLSMPLEPSATACLIAAWNSRRILTKTNFT